MFPSRVMAAAGDLTMPPVLIPIAGFPLHLAWPRRRAKGSVLRYVAGMLASPLR